MTDHELNAAMARTCGMATRLEPFDYRKPTPPSPYVTECSGRWTLVAGKGVAEVYWNPCGDWNQVAEFVIPALNELGIDVIVYWSQGGIGVTLEPTRPLDLGFWKVHKGSEPPCTTPRCLCLAALGVREKLGAVQ